MGRPKKDRTGEIGVNTNGEEMRIIRYGNRRDIDVLFEDGTIVEHKQYNDFKNANIKNPMFPIVCEVGYFGIGNYSSKENGKLTKCYATWKGMLMRCYDSKYHEKYPTYATCTVDKRWHNFQVFAEWYYKNYYEFEGQMMTLDKDILNKGNKVYSPNNCIFVPQFINKLFIKSDNSRGNCPIGVCKQGNRFIAQLHKGNEKQYLGSYLTVEEAFLVYKNAKENYIKEVAEEYKLQIPQKLYDAMIAYEVEIDD